MGYYLCEECGCIVEVNDDKKVLWGDTTKYEYKCRGCDHVGYIDYSKPLAKTFKEANSARRKALELLCEPLELNRGIDLTSGKKEDFKAYREYEEKFLKGVKDRMNNKSSDKEMFSDNVARYEKEGFTVIGWNFSRDIESGNVELTIDYIDDFGDRESWTSYFSDSYTESDRMRVKRYQDKKWRRAHGE